MFSYCAAVHIMRCLWLSLLRIEVHQEVQWIREWQFRVECTLLTAYDNINRTKQTIHVTHTHACTHVCMYASLLFSFLSKTCQRFPAIVCSYFFIQLRAIFHFLFVDVCYSFVDGVSILPVYVLFASKQSDRDSFFYLYVCSLTGCVWDRKLY